MSNNSKIVITLNDGRDITHTHSSSNEVKECQDYLKSIGKSDKDVAWVTFDSKE